MIYIPQLTDVTPYFDLRLPIDNDIHINEELTGVLTFVHKATLQRYVWTYTFVCDDYCTNGIVKRPSASEIPPLGDYDYTLHVARFLVSQGIATFRSLDFYTPHESYDHLPQKTQYED